MANRRDGVILLHGIGRGASSMGRLERALRNAGYRTLNLDYPARRRDLSALAAHVQAASSRWTAGVDDRVHLVTHSMGGLVARAFITRHRPGKLGRVVMLALPNQGSEIADLLERIPLYKRIYGPAGAQLTTRRSEDLASVLGPVDYPLGVIAGDRSIDPLGWAFLPKPNDGKVTVAHTKVDGMTDHITLPATHSLIMRNAAVIAACLVFLRDGRFARSDGPVSRRRPLDGAGR